MCFSAEASFIAFIPLIFALQQFTEGWLWVVLESGEMPLAQFWLANLYGVFIGVIWPFYAPFAIYKGEVDGKARKVVTSMILVGLGLAVYTIIGLLGEPIVAHIVNDSIRYVHNVEGQQFVLTMYLFATCVPFILSSDRYLYITGVVINFGFFVAFFAYRETFASVWCFFAAISSAMIYFYVVSGKSSKLALKGCS